MVDTMLQQWEEYMKSPTYLKERNRARKERPQEEKSKELDAKVRVCKLRHQCRYCRRLRKKLADGSMQQVPYYDEKLYKRFLDGDLQNELDEATIAHGYGTLSTGESIGAVGPNYTCASLAKN